MGSGGHRALGTCRSASGRTCWWLRLTRSLVAATAAPWIQGTGLRGAPAPPGSTGASRGSTRESGPVSLDHSSRRGRRASLRKAFPRPACMSWGLRVGSEGHRQSWGSGEPRAGREGALGGGEPRTGLDGGCGSALGRVSPFPGINPTGRPPALLAKPRGSSEGRRGSGWAAPLERRGQGEAASILGRRWLAGSAMEVLPAGPPSYETHMLRRLRVGQGSRKSNEPRPPPYISPPAYDAPHRTLPTKRPRAVPAPPARLARLPHEVLGGWSYHVGSGSLGRRTGSGLLCLGLEGAVQSTAQGGSAESLFRPLSSPDSGSHTLPRAAGGASRARGSGGWDAAWPGSAPGRQRLPSGWGFGYAASSTGSTRSGQREGWEQRGRPERRAPPSPCRSRHGGIFVIDATCVVIRAEYIPPPKREQVRLLGSPPPRDPASPCQRLLLASRPHLGASERAARPPLPSPGDGSLGERAARLLGLPTAELGLEEPQGACAQQENPGHWSQQTGAALPGSPERLVGGPRVHGLPSPAALPPRARPCAKRPALCTRDLREAVSRIRRHTAPDSDTDEEPEGLAPRSHMAWRGRPRHEALACSSSSLESSGSDATVVPAGEGAPPGAVPEAGEPGQEAWSGGQEGLEMSRAAEPRSG
uniref:Dendrin n=1 Tax=Gopherus evgoodei TaxID=1825980 RepID=A0A8C4W7L2_9SAUR